MSLTNEVIKNIVKKVIKGQDYRIEIVNLINAEFLQFVIDFFKKVVDAKMNNVDITDDWYRKEFLSLKLCKEDIVINSGLNMKTVSNMYNSSRKEICIDASNEHYESLYGLINRLIEDEKDLNLTLTIKFRNISVDLNLNESLVLINTLAVKRAQLRGGLWSTAGKQAEKVLMKTLCRLYNVPDKHCIQDNNPVTFRETDFFLYDIDNKPYKCEVKLMGKGNPESADAIFARDTNIFVADKMSDRNKKQCEMLNIHWVELRNYEGYKRFEKILKFLNIPFNEINENIDNKLDNILDSLVKDVGAGKEI